MARSAVGRSRSSSKKNNKAGHPAKAPLSTPSQILQSILSDLGISYDVSLGTLDGEVIVNGPNLDNLSVLKKSLGALKLQLEKVIAQDASLVAKIDERLDEEESTKARGAKRSIDEVKAADVKTKEEDVEKEVVVGDDDEEEEEEEEDEELKPKKKRSKIKQEAIDVEPVVEDLKDEDDDDVPLATVRANNRVGTVAASAAPENEDQEETAQDEEKEEDYGTTPEGDTRVKNPKSEFVTSQTLPAAAAALGLFSEETGGLDQTGEEYLKQKYAVASYPTRDLKDMLPGAIPNVDFSKSKPSNQVQFTTFQSYTDVYFKNYSEEDIKVLKEKYIVAPTLGKNYDPALHPFLIPKLGPLYSESWSQEEPLDGVKLSTPSQPPVSADLIMPKGSSEQLTDELLETDNVSCGPLVTRLLSALIPDQADEPTGAVKNEDDEDGELVAAEETKPTTTTSSSSALGDQQGWNAKIVQADYSQLEQRLRRELKYVGVYMNVNQTLKDRQASLTGGVNGVVSQNESNAGKQRDEFQEDWISGREDDEICAETRYLQRELSQLNRKNNKRKQMLIPLVEEQIAWQEYMSILDDLDKQIDQAYLKRMRVPKKAKKRGHATAAQQAVQLTPSALAAQQAQQAQQAAANSGLKSLLDKRTRWINKIGPLFKAPELMRRIPKESVFKDVDLSKEEEDNYELDDGTSGINNDTNGAELMEEDVNGN